jgi:hypothetical protein
VGTLEWEKDGSVEGLGVDVDTAGLLRGNVRWRLPDIEPTLRVSERVQRQDTLNVICVIST